MLFARPTVNRGQLRNGGCADADGTLAAASEHEINPAANHLNIVNLQAWPVPHQHRCRQAYAVHPQRTTRQRYVAKAIARLSLAGMTKAIARDRTAEGASRRDRDGAEFWCGTARDEQRNGIRR